MSIRPPVRKDVAAMDGYHSPQVEVSVRLNTNESPVPPPAAFTERLTERLSSVEWNRYPDRAATELRSAIAAHHGVRLDQVFAANGSNEVLQTLLLTYGGPGRTIVTFEPTYALHGHIGRITGTEVVEGERGDDFSLDPAHARQVIRDASPIITFLCSPNNPTGMVEPADLIRSVIEWGTEAGGLVVVDEAYGQFAPHSALDLIDEDLPLVVTRTFSKTWSMAASRLGYLVGPSWLVAELEKVVLPYHLDVVSQISGSVALEFEAEMNERVAAQVEERGRMVAALSELPVTVWPSGANFVLFRPDDHDGAEVWVELVERSVLIRNCASWPRLDGCLRITVGTPEEDDLFLQSLTEILT